MNDTDLRNIALSYAVNLAVKTGNVSDVLFTAELYLAFLKGSTT